MCDLIPIPNEFDDANDFWSHPIYDRWEANREGVVRHVKHKKDIGCLNKFGYLKISLVNDEGIRKHYQKHRFIFECFHGKINDVKLVVDHVNNIKIDNRLENLQLITQSQNIKKEHRKGKKLPSIRVRATNINSRESFDYDSIKKCGKGLDIHIGSISGVLNGITKTATSKLDKNKYKFEKNRLNIFTSFFNYSLYFLFIFISLSFYYFSLF